jgi:signal peptidase I
MIKRVLNFILDSIQALVLALSVFVLLYLFVAQPNQVNGQSMMPNFEDRAFLLTDKISYKTKQPARGDVVVFKAPASEECSEDECEYIKRVIGLPGETIMIQNDSVYINGSQLEEDYLPASFFTRPGSFLSLGKPLKIHIDEYILMGDNRSHSRDSREFGLIPGSDIVGKAFWVYWPPNLFGKVPKVTY